MIETNKYVSETKGKYYERDQYENALVCNNLQYFRYEFCMY